MRVVVILHKQKGTEWHAHKDSQAEENTSFAISCDNNLPKCKEPADIFVYYSILVLKYSLLNTAAFLPNFRFWS